MLKHYEIVGTTLSTKTTHVTFCIVKITPSITYGDNYNILHTTLQTTGGTSGSCKAFLQDRAATSQIQ